MPVDSRHKGNDGELEVRDKLRAAGFDCDRVPNSGGLRIKGDLYGDVPAHFEVKRAERVRLPEWWAQARDEAPAGVLPVLALRWSRGEWLAVVPLDALVALLATVSTADAAATHDLGGVEPAGAVRAALGESRTDPADDR